MQNVDRAPPSPNKTPTKSNKTLTERPDANVTNKSTEDIQEDVMPKKKHAKSDKSAKPTDINIVDKATEEKKKHVTSAKSAK